MYKKIAIVMSIVVILAICGCVSQETTAKSDYKRNVVVCPNPECLLHDPDYWMDGSRATPRPIDMETFSNSGRTVYLCQVCGEEWVGKR